jgi:hypothetical protein
MLCVLLLVGCATTEGPPETARERAAFALVYRDPLLPAPLPTSEVIRLVDSRMIREILRQKGNENQLALSPTAKVTISVIASIGLLYLLTDDDDDASQNCPYGGAPVLGC